MTKKPNKKAVPKAAKKIPKTDKKLTSAKSAIPAYNHLKIEQKWQKIWDKTPGLNRAIDNDKKREKLFMLVEFPFPSGAGLHIGHVRSYTALDIIARKNRMQGKNVLYPIGWDAFGLPTENYAIKTGIHPKIATKQNTDNFTKQLKSLGFSFDWSRLVDTTDPHYYKWTQWIFLQLLKKGLAYRSKIAINWCPKDKIGLANEEVVAGCCERCGTKVEKKEKEQWMLAITKYADRLDKDLDSVDYPEKVKLQQRNWIGRSEGSEIDFAIEIAGAEGSKKAVAGAISSALDEKITVFTTRADTLYGATYVVLAPEHALVEKLKPAIKNWRDIEAYRKMAVDIDEADRLAADKEKTGVMLQGVCAIHPITKEKLPVWIADYVLASYGTGAVMAVPAHDERDFAFAKKYKLPVKRVIMPRRIDQTNPHAPGKKIVFRKLILALVRNPKTKQILTLKWKAQNWTTFIVGGIEDGETPEAAARREILEETGYSKIKLVKTLNGPVQSEFFAKHKDVNRVAHTWTLLFELTDNSVPHKISDEESAKHSLEWQDESKVLKLGALNHAELDLVIDRMTESKHPGEKPHEAPFTKAMIEDGIVFDSGSASTMTSAQAREILTKEAGGRKVIKYKLRDWVFSRQRYWGEPIPVVHCGRCVSDSVMIRERITSQQKEGRKVMRINFHKKEIWDALEKGIKTVESRALNPDEPDRYFGDIQVGDIIECIPKFAEMAAQEGKGKSKTTDKNHKKTLANIKIKPLYFEIEETRAFKSFDELFKDKEWLKRVSSKGIAAKSVSELKKNYAALVPGYAEKVEANGLVCWKFKKVTVPIPLPEKSLPLVLPNVKKYEPTDNGESPLAAISSWINTTCPVCNGPATRETDVMPNWAGSSWYYLRYTDPKNNKAFADKKKLDYWTPVNWYNGGMEHTTLHLLYSRFWHKFLFDQGHVPTKEPYAKRTSHGLIMASDGTKMSKSKGNVVNPDDVVRIYGADTLRLFEMFIGPFEQMVAWSENGLIGPRRFVERVYKLHERLSSKKTGTELSKESLSLLHKTIKKVTEDIDSLNMNTCISSLMILTNQLEKEPAIPAKEFNLYLALIAPFMPHVAEELNAMAGNKKSVAMLPWPAFDPKLLAEEVITMGVQINGKSRGTVTISAELSKDEHAVKNLALALPEIQNRIKAVGDKSPDKVIFVPGRIINLIFRNL